MNFSNESILIWACFIITNLNNDPLDFFDWGTLCFCFKRNFNMPQWVMLFWCKLHFSLYNCNVVLFWYFLWELHIATPYLDYNKNDNKSFCFMDSSLFRALRIVSFDDITHKSDVKDFIFPKICQFHIASCMLQTRLD